MTADDFTWTTSSYSSNGGAECVEVGRVPGDNTPVALRDSKNRAAGHFTLPTHEWSAFLHAVRAHEY